MKIFTQILSAGLIIFLMSILSYREVSAQFDPDKNKEFVLTFLPNYHNNWYSEVSSEARGDSIFIFIYAEVPTTGTIEFRNRNGNVFVENFSIPDPQSIYVFKRVARDYALIGVNVSSQSNFGRNDAEKITPYSFRIKSDNPIQVYGHSEATTTSESFNVLPIESLGNEYFILTYNSNNDAENWSFGDQRTPSQFAIVASEDGTVAEISPSSETASNRTSPFTVNLNAGDVYLVQNTADHIHNLDLSGSFIKSNKPVAIFAGHQRARIPLNASITQSSRDYLVEQMVPVDSWSNEAIITPFPAPSNFQRSETHFDLFRVIAAYDNTELFMNGVNSGVLNRGEIIEYNLKNPVYIQASAPIMAVTLKRSSGLTGSAGGYRGDPLLQLVPTPNQFGSSYRFITIQTYRNNSKIFTEQYITILSKADNLASLNLNGTSINPNIFMDIPASEYKYAIMQIPDGTYTMTADNPFGLFVCGYGYAVSYGYYCGIIAKRDDFEPPVLQATEDCFEIKGIVTDKKLKQISIPESENENVIVDVEEFTPFVEEASFSAKLDNIYRDGHFAIAASDSIGQKIEEFYEIAGFTVALISELELDDAENILTLKDSSRVGTRHCFTYRLINYGKFPQTITNANFKYFNVGLTSDFPESFTLLPGEELEFEICLESESNVHFIDTLVIGNNCHQRNVLAVGFKFSKDENEPQISADEDPCNKYVVLSITDSLSTDYGFDLIEIISKENLDIDIIDLGLNYLEITANVIDEYRDSYVKIGVTDLGGNYNEYEKFIPGFTIDFTIDEDSTLNFGNKIIGLRYCDSIRLWNYGSHEITLEDPYLYNNVRFSIPPSQLPIILQADEVKYIKVCFFGNKGSYEDVRDSMRVTFNCIDKLIRLRGTVDSLTFNGDTKCDIPLLIELGELPDGVFVGESYPNPAGSIVNIDFNISEPNDVDIKLFDLNGSAVKSLQMNNLSAAYYTIPVDVNSLPNGIYTAVIKLGADVFRRSIVISK